MLDTEKDLKEKYAAAIQEERDNTQLLQIAVVLLAVVSFFTTANGMSQYIFSGNKAIAYAASAAVQGVLLSLNMNLPGYLRGIWRQKWNLIYRCLLCITVLCLTVTAIFCSSWFSYIYIAEVIHQDSWGTDSELLVQQVYRTELNNAQEYARTYRIYLEEAVGEKILLIEEEAAQLQDNMVDFGLDWADEEEIYVINGGAAAASYMAPVLDAMEKVNLDNSSQENRDLAAKAVEDAANHISARITAVQQNLDDLDRRITMYDNQIANLTSRIRNAVRDTDITSLSNSINNYTQLINNAVQEQTLLQTEQTQLNNALLRLPVYESFLGLNSSTSAISIRTTLMELQSEFFKQEPDEALLLKIATDIFESLRRGGSENYGDSLSYTNLLVQMNRLIRNLTDYSEIKDIENALSDLNTELRSGRLTAGSEAGESGEPLESTEIIEAPDASESADSPESADSLESADASESADTSESADISESADSPESAESPESTELTGAAESQNPAESPESADSPDSTEWTSSMESDKLMQDSPESSDAADSKNKHGQWQQVWGDRVERLKAQISAMPAYSESDAANGSNTILTESQTNILRGYDRNESSKTLDDSIRRYITNHSAIYQGIIYLQSPYRSLAIFGLILALCFDLTGFVFGAVIAGNPQQGSSFLKTKDSGSFNSNITTGQYSSPEWTILETQNKYNILTGDYECKDGVYYYKVFSNGMLDEWPVEAEKVKAVYTQGIYHVKSPVYHGTKVETEQELLFSNQTGGPMDGVLKDCRLFFDEGSLIKEYEGKGKKAFVTCIDEYVPVHIYNPERGENQTIPALNLTENNKVEVQTGVIALNETGTRVVTIYVIGK